MRILVLLFCLVLFSDAHAARALPDDNLAYAVSIALASGNNGSGFFLNTPDAVYLITAKHVLFEPKTGELLSGSAILTAYSGDPKDQTPTRLKLNLSRLLSSGAIRSHQSRDIVAMRIGIAALANLERQIQLVDGVEAEQSSKDGILGADISNLRKFEDVLISNDVFLFGYPTSLGLKDLPQLDLKRPLLRRGIVAGLNIEQQLIVIDCPAYPGNSGGPVVEVDVENFVTRSLKIIGVVTQFVPWMNATLTPDNPILANSGYSIVTPVDFALELIEAAPNKSLERSRAE